MLVAVELIDLVDFSEPESTAKVIAAVVTVLGIVFTGVVTFVGIEIKRSLGERQLQLGQQAEARLRLESGIKAVELFKSATGDRSQMETAGALFALARLGELDFALHLLGHLWPEHKINRETALWVINECLESDSQRNQEYAAMLLRVNAAELPVDAGNISLPSCLLDPGQVALPEDAVLTCVVAICVALQTRPRSEWHAGTLARLLALLCGFIEDLGDNDAQKPTRHSIARVAREIGATLIPALQIQGRTGNRNVGAVMKELEVVCNDEVPIVRAIVIQQAVRLADWRTGQKTEDDRA